MFQFTLTYSGADTVVAEPRGWDDFKSEVKRDFDAHGVIFKYTPGTLRLGFADGRSILETAFQNDGYDAIVTLKVEKRNTAQDSWVTVYTGNAVMQNRELSELYFDVDFETSTFQQKVINRLNIPVDLETTLDLDGGTLTGTITEQSDTLKSIRLNKYLDALIFEDDAADTDDLDASLRTATDADFSAKEQFVWFGFGVKRLETLEEINLKASKVFIGNEDYYVDGNPPQPLWIAKTGGAATFTGDLNYSFNLTMFHDATADVQTAYALKLVQYRNEAVQSTTTIDNDNDSSVAAAAPSTTHIYTSGGNPIAQAISITITDIKAGDEFYLVFETSGQVDAGNNSFDTAIAIANTDGSGSNASAITIVQLQAQFDTSLRHWLVHDVFERLAYILTGNSAGFYSDFFGLTDHGYASDGCGGLNTITNGYSLRQNNIPPLVMSMRELLDWAQARYGVGWGFEVSGSTYRIRVELVEHFYSDAEILDLGTPIKEVGSYMESSVTELAFNRVVVGYHDYFDAVNVNGVQEDFLTESNYSLPVSTVKGDYTKLSPLIASNDIIQAGYERRGTSESWKYDENNFIIAINRSGAAFIQENIEFFNEVAGLDDDASAYNIRHAPVYMFLEHALLVNSVLFGKDTSELIQNTSVKINRNFWAIQNNYSCLLADIQQLKREATGNIAISDNFVSQRLFKPVYHKFTAAMSTAQLDDIIDAMENNNSDADKNRGYLTYTDAEGNTQTGWPILITWNPNDEIAEVTTIEKSDIYGI